MNITHVVENLNRGGLERMVIDLVKLQQAQGHRCQLLCLFERGSLAKELDSLGVPVIACGKRRGVDLRALVRLRAALRRHATEVLHTHNAVAHYHAIWASRGLGIRRVVNTRHGMGANRRSGRREWLYRRALTATNDVVTVCAAARDDAVRRGIVPVTKVRVVPNGIPVNTFLMTCGSERAALRHAIGIAPHARIIGTVGRLNWTKDHAGLIRAFKMVCMQIPDAVLLLIGDGELRTELEQTAAVAGVAERVKFLGDRNDVRELLRGLDLFVLSSLSEGYSMALLEASAAALPIIATAVGGNGEIVRDGITGNLVPPRDPVGLADAMIILLRDLERAQAYGQAARAWVEAEGSLETMWNRYAAIYEGSTG